MVFFYWLKNHVSPEKDKVKCRCLLTFDRKHHCSRSIIEGHLDRVVCCSSRRNFFFDLMPKVATTHTHHCHRLFVEGGLLRGRQLALQARHRPLCPRQSRRHALWPCRGRQPLLRHGNRQTGGPGVGLKGCSSRWGKTFTGIYYVDLKLFVSEVSLVRYFFIFAHIIYPNTLGARL